MSDPNLEIRLQRARSWILLAEALSKDSPSDMITGETKSIPNQARIHMRFVCYWIGFNCMYGLTPIDPDNLDKEPESQMKEIGTFLARVKEMGRVDREKKTYILDEAVRKCRSDAKDLIEDAFLSRTYWEGERSPGNIKSVCESEWKHAREALDKNRDYDSFLHLAFHRLTVLRNQIIHGSATANPQSEGYTSLRTGVCFLHVMVPALYRLVESYGDCILKWPKAPYPRKSHREHPHL